MNKATFKSALAKIKADDQFRQETISLMMQKQSEKTKPRAARKQQKGLIWATGSVLLVIVALTLLLLSPAFNSALPTTTAMPTPPSSQITTAANSTAHEQRTIVRSKDYAGDLVDIMLPDQGQAVLSSAVQRALADPDNRGKFFYVQIHLIPAEQYAHPFDQYRYQGRTIGEWRELVDLSKGTYPYSEYNGDHGGQVTVEEWKQKQAEAKTLAAQKNCDAATAQYQAEVQPLIDAARTACMHTECARLVKAGFDVALQQTWQYGNASEKQYFSILAGLLTPKQIETFAAAPELGYLIDWMHNGDGIAEWAGQ